MRCHLLIDRSSERSMLAPTMTGQGTRERIVTSSAELFRRQGYTGTGMKQIVAEAQAPFGSIYHFFPGGKEELGAEVIRWSGEMYGCCSRRSSTPRPTSSPRSARSSRSPARTCARPAGRTPARSRRSRSRSRAPARRCARRAPDVFTGWVEAGTARFRAAGLAPEDARALTIGIDRGARGRVRARARRSAAPSRSRRPARWSPPGRGSIFALGRASPRAARPGGSSPAPRGPGGAGASSGPSAGRSTAIGRSVAMSWNVRSRSGSAVSAPRVRGVISLRGGRRGEHALEVAEARQQVGGALRADALRAREAVRRVAAQRDEVRHLLGLDRRSARAPRPGRSRPGRPSRGNRTCTRVGDALEHVAVAGEEQRLAAGRRLAARQRAEQVVGLEASRRSSDVHPNASKNAARVAHWCSSSSGIGGRSAW